MRTKFTYSALFERFGLQKTDLTRLMNLGILMADGWVDYSQKEKLQAEKEHFRFMVWDITEIERFENVLRLIQKNYQIFYQTFSLRLDHLESRINDVFGTINERNLSIFESIQDIKALIEERDEWLDSKEFCKITGYRQQTFYNSIQIVDALLPSMRLKIDFYKKLIWIKRGKRWMTQRNEFEKLRRGFTYEVYLQERHRKGEVKQKPKFTLENLK